MALEFLQVCIPDLIMYGFKVTVQWCHQEERPVLPELATFIKDPYPLVRSAAVYPIYTALDSQAQWRFKQALAEAIWAVPDPGMRLAAINATRQLLPDIAPDLQLEYCHLVLRALGFAICDYDYWQVQDHASSAMINISMNYPLHTLPYLCDVVGFTVGSLLEDHASSRESLEEEDSEDSAWDRIQNSASESLLLKLERGLPHDAWASILSSMLSNRRQEYHLIWNSIHQHATTFFNNPKI